MHLAAVPGDAVGVGAQRFNAEALHAAVVVRCGLLADMGCGKGGQADGWVSWARGYVGG